MKNLPPGPYHYMTTAKSGDNEGYGHVYICDATGRKIATMWGPPDAKMALATLIIEAEQRFEGMNEITKRVARAIEDKWNERFDAWYRSMDIEPPPRLPDPELFEALTIAAIAAMREPTEEMWKAASLKADIGKARSCVAWRAMVDAALHGDPE